MLYFMTRATSQSLHPSCFADAQQSEWGVVHRAVRVPPPRSELPVLHHPAGAVPSHPVLFLPGFFPRQRLDAPRPSSRIPCSQFGESLNEARAHHWGGVLGLHGGLGTLDESFLVPRGATLQLYEWNAVHQSQRCFVNDEIRTCFGANKAIVFAEGLCSVVECC